MKRSRRAKSGLDMRELDPPLKNIEAVHTSFEKFKDLFNRQILPLMKEDSMSRMSAKNFGDLVQEMASLSNEANELLEQMKSKTSMTRIVAKIKRVARL